MSSERHNARALARETARLEAEMPLTALDSYNEALTEVLSSSEDRLAEIKEEALKNANIADVKRHWVPAKGSLMATNVHWNWPQAEGLEDRFTFAVKGFPLRPVPVTGTDVSYLPAKEVSALMGVKTRKIKRIYRMETILKRELSRIRKYSEDADVAYEKWMKATIVTAERNYRKWLRRPKGRFTFSPKPFSFRLYKPRWFDFRTHSALVPVAPPTADPPLDPHPVVHAKETLSVGHLHAKWQAKELDNAYRPVKVRVEFDGEVDMPLSFTPMRSEDGSISLEPTLPGARAIGRLAYRPLVSVADYDSQAAAAACKSCVADASVQTDVPQFLAELGDLPKALKTFWKCYDNVAKAGYRLLAPNGRSWKRYADELVHVSMLDKAAIRRALHVTDAEGLSGAAHRLLDEYAVKKAAKLVDQGAPLLGHQMSDFVRRVGFAHLGLDLTRHVAGADLARKFGLEPSIRDLMDAGAFLFGKLDALYKRIADYFQRNGRRLKYHRLFSKRSFESEGDVDILKVVDRFSRPGDSSGWQTLEALWRGLSASGLEWSPVYTPPPVLHWVGSSTVTWRVTPIITEFFVSLTGRRLSDDELANRVVSDWFGFNFRPSLIWDLIPFSFVADWVADIGDLIDQLTYIPNARSLPLWGDCVITRSETLNLRAFQHSESLSRESNLTPEWAFSTIGRLDVDWTYTNYAYKLFERWVVDPEDMLPLDSITIRTGKPGWWEALTSCELFF